jgi:hypothetical protein
MYARGTPSTCSIRISYTDRGNAYGICSARVFKCLRSLAIRQLVSGEPRWPHHLLKQHRLRVPLRNGSRVRRKRFVKTVAITEVA